MKGEKGSRNAKYIYLRLFMMMTTVRHLRNLTGPELNFRILLTPVILDLAMALRFDQKTVILHHEHKGLNTLLHISPRNPAVTLLKVLIFTQSN